MKTFIMWKMHLMILGLGAALAFAPASRAQSEVDPDHFDGTDSWAAAAVAKVTPTLAKGAPNSRTRQARSTKPGASVLTATNEHASTASTQRPALVAVQDKRKAVRKPKNQ